MKQKLLILIKNELTKKDPLNQKKTIEEKPDTTAFLL
jgi:hypothetical protein